MTAFRLRGPLGFAEILGLPASDQRAVLKGRSRLRQFRAHLHERPVYVVEAFQELLESRVVVSSMPRPTSTAYASECGSHSGRPDGPQGVE